ncbi:Protein of unknown function DUF3435, partial [Penicillium cf. griseofulvum]
PIPEQANYISSNLSIAKDPSTIEDTLAISRPSSPPTARSILKCSRARTILSSKPLVRYPSIAMVIPNKELLGQVQGPLRSTILTVESNTSLKPVYFFTFVPDPSPILPLAYTAVIPLLKYTYTSDENTLLVQLKEKEAILWSKITTYFLGRNILSLQVHYSTKLYYKASSRSRRPKKR